MIVWTDFTRTGSSIFDSSNARCWYPLCWPWACCAPTALYLLQRCLVSFVRGTCVLRLCGRFYRQESGFRRCYWFLRDWPKNQHFLGVFVDFSGARGELPPPRYGCQRLLASSRGNKLSIRSCLSNSVSSHFTKTILEKVLVVFNHAMLKSFKNCST